MPSVALALPSGSGQFRLQRVFFPRAERPVGGEDSTGGVRSGEGTVRGDDPEVPKESCESTWALEGGEEWRAETEVPVGGSVSCCRESGCAVIGWM